MLPTDLSPRKRTIAGVWSIVAAAYTPAVWMIGDAQGQRGSFLAAFAAMMVVFLPWALSTPSLLRLSSELPLGSGRTPRSLVRLTVVGAVGVPVVTGTGLTLEWASAWALGIGHPGSLARLPIRVAITSFFSVPIYGGVVAIGQALVWADRTRQQERSLAQARLDTLRAQLNPHFLFNALGAVGELVHRDAGAAQSAIARLADVLRTTLASNSAEVTMAQEIALTKDHIELHRLLLPNQIDVRFVISADAWRARVPALVLQPLVENALVHGLGRMNDGGWLTIKATVDHGRLFIEVANALLPISPPSHGLGSGLQNVRERLAAWRDARSQLVVDRNSDRFVVKLNLPFVPDEMGE